MGRSFVHLTTTPETAALVAKRKAHEVSIIKIDAQAAHEAGVVFYHIANTTWLVSEVSPDYFNEVMDGFL